MASIFKRIVNYRVLNVCYTLNRTYADIAPKKFSIGSMTKKKELPVETDVNKLVEYVCGTDLLKEGGETVKLKPESEYPDWLWELDTGPPKKLEELDPNSIEYWERVRKLASRRNCRRRGLRMLKPY